MQNLIHRYLAWKAINTSRAPTAYKIHLNRFSKIIHKLPRKICFDDVSKFSEMMKIKFAESYRAYAITILKDFFKYGNSVGEMSINHELIKIPKFLPRRRVVVEKEDFKKMCESLNQWEFYELQKLVIISMLWDSGMRISELCGLNLSDIETDKNYTQIITKKAKSFGWVMWSKETHKLLLRYIGIRICLNQRNELFTATEKRCRRERVTRRTVQRWVRQICQCCGITKLITPHSFRHGKAHQMIKRGANVKEIQVILRHSEDNPRAAFQYIRLDQKESLGIAGKYLCA